jgi:hypothetical protein
MQHGHSGNGAGSHPAAIRRRPSGARHACEPTADDVQRRGTNNARRSPVKLMNRNPPRSAILETRTVGPSSANTQRSRSTLSSDFLLFWRRPAACRSPPTARACSSATRRMRARGVPAPSPPTNPALPPPQKNRTSSSTPRARAGAAWRGARCSTTCPTPPSRRVTEIPVGIERVSVAPRTSDEA